VAGSDRRVLLPYFFPTEVYHRVDVAHLSGDVFAIGVMNSPESTSSEALGEGWWVLYNWETDLFPGYGSLGEGIRTVRVADGCNSSGTRWSWYTWEQNGNVYYRRMRSNGTWGGSLLSIAGARYPVVVRGTNDNGTDRVVLLYERSYGGRSYLYYRFLYCNGAIGSAYPLRSVGEPWVIWHIESAYDTYLDRWQIFWDEFNNNDFENYADMRTKHLWWDGSHSASVVVCNCVGGTPCDPGCSERNDTEDHLELHFDESEDYDYPPGVGMPSENVIRSETEGCKRFFVSFDSSEYNGSHRFLLSLYPSRFWFVSEDGEVCDTDNLADLSIPLTGICNDDACSYQEIGICDGSLYDRRLSHRRFTDLFGWCSSDDDDDCDDLDFPEYPVTPYGPRSEPLAMATNDEVSLVVYLEDVAPYDFWGTLFMTVIDN
jgi:hypothetical protein